MRLILIAVTVLLALCFAGWAVRANIQQNRTAVVSLCALRADVERRMNDTWEYLYDVRIGKRDAIPGISEADFVRSIEGQQSTIRALSHLDCD